MIGGRAGAALRIVGVPKAVAGEGAPKLLTSGVPVAVPLNVLMTGVAVNCPVPLVTCTGVPVAGENRLPPLALGPAGGPGVLSPVLAPPGYRTLNADMPEALTPRKKRNR